MPRVFPLFNRCLLTDHGKLLTLSSSFFPCGALELKARVSLSRIEAFLGRLDIEGQPADKDSAGSGDTTDRPRAPAGGLLVQNGTFTWPQTVSLFRPIKNLASCCWCYPLLRLLEHETQLRGRGWVSTQGTRGLITSFRIVLSAYALYREGQSDRSPSTKSHAAGRASLCAAPFARVYFIFATTAVLNKINVSRLRPKHPAASQSVPCCFLWRLPVSATLLTGEAFPFPLSPVSSLRFTACTQEPEKLLSDEAGDSGHEEEKCGQATDDTPPTTTPSPTSSLLSPADQAPTLGDVTLEVKPGELVCVYGPTGCGKSSLLLSLLGEVRRVEGTVEVRARSETLEGEAERVVSVRVYRG